MLVGESDLNRHMSWRQSQAYELDASLGYIVRLSLEQ